MRKAVMIVIVALFMNNVFANDECLPCTHVYNGGPANFNMGLGEVLCIQSGTLTGNVNINGSNVVICIAEGAVYSPNNFNFINGLKIVNRGTFIINGANVNHKGYIDNYGTVEVRGNLNFNNDLEVKNFGIWINVPNFEFKRNSLFINEGYVECRAEFSSEPNTSFVNNGRMKIVQNFNPNGEFLNNGPLVTSEFININPQAKLINQCFLYSGKGFNNNSNHTQNMGLIQTSPGMPIQLNNQYWQGGSGTLHGGSLINNAAVTGDGYYYFTGNTVNHSQFGNVASSIQFHDVSNSGNAFDTENGTSDISSTHYFEPMDTNTVKANCPGIAPILPVELTSFTAIVEKGGALLNWSTASEKNNDRFEVMRSTDGVNFVKIGEVDGNGTTAVPQNYEFLDIDITVSTGVYYYQLQQVDFDGASELSKMVSVEIHLQQGMVYPNPVRDILFMPFEGVKEIYSLEGQLISTIQGGSLDLSGLSPGMYVLKTGYDQFQKIIKI